jgi:HEAT repeat protein
VLAVTISGGARGEAARLAREALELVRGAEAADPWDGKTGEEARRALVDALEAPSWGVRWRAARNLGRLKADWASDAALEKAVRDTDATVRVAALRALAARGWLDRAPAEARAAVARDPDWTVRLAYCRLRELDLDLKELLAMLDDPHPALRAFGFAVIEKLDQEKWIPWSKLRAGIGDPDGAARLAALEAFHPWQRGVVRSEAEDVLVQALRDPNAMVRAKAVDHLDDFVEGSPRIVAALVAALSDDSHHVRWEAVHALRDAGPGAAAGLPALVAMLDEEWLRARAAEVIGRIGVRDEGATRKLEAGLAAGDPDYRFEAARALWRLGSAPEGFVDIVVETLRGDSYVRAEAAETLGDLGEHARPYVPDLIAALHDETCRYDATRSLGRLGAVARDALPELERVRDSDDAYLRDAANEAIQRIYVAIAREAR